MDKSLLTIGLSSEINTTFKSYFALDNICLISCKDSTVAIKLLKEKQFYLIILNVLSLTSEDTQEITKKLRSITYAPILVLSSKEAAAPTMELSGDVCI